MIPCATSKNHQALPQALQFVRWFAFLHNSAAHTDEALKLNMFEALDFGTDTDGQGESWQVMLQC